jgi:hypothetical protein
MSNDIFSFVSRFPAWSFKGVTDVGFLPPPCSPLFVIKYLFFLGNNMSYDASMIYKDGAEPGGPPSVTPLNDEGLPPVTQEKTLTLISTKINGKTPRPLTYSED